MRIKKSGILEGGVSTKDEKVKLELNHVKFDRSRFRRYIGNIGEMIAQEVLLKEGFEVWLLTPYFPEVSPAPPREERQERIKLKAFLKKEGLLQKIPSYKLIMVSVADEDEPILTLLGLKPTLLEQLSPGDRKKALSYLNESIKGAKHFEVEHSDMLEAKNTLEHQ